MPIKEELAQSLSGQWQVGLFEAPCKSPAWFCCGCCCPCCMAARQRHKILDVLQEPYVCCGGLFPCGPLGQPQDRNCVWCEACCCLGLAVSGNRFLIQTRLDRQNTFCDDCLIWTACIAQTAVCLLNCVGCDVPDEVENIVDCFAMTVTGCMLAQQEVEIDHAAKTGYPGMSPAILNMMPPNQMQMCQSSAKFRQDENMQGPYGQPHGQPYPQQPYGQPYPQQPYGQPYPQQPYGQPYPQQTYGQHHYGAA